MSPEMMRERQARFLAEAERCIHMRQSATVTALSLKLTRPQAQNVKAKTQFLRPNLYTLNPNP